MAKNLNFLTVLTVVFIIGLTGCAKKITKVAPSPETPPPIEQPKEPTPQAPQDDSFKPLDMDAQLREVLQTVYFDYNKYDLKSDAIGVLGKIASFMKDHSTLRLLAQGHCDERGSSDYNMGLGERRAKAVKDYLVSYGIAANRVETTSYGKERPARSNCSADESCNSQNRRVEWQVLAK